MKIRTGFVSNSSSSSFIIQKNLLTRKQIQQIHDHLEESKEWVRFDWCDEQWNIEEDEYVIAGDVWMDNFPMDAFLERIGVSPADVKWR